MDTLALSYVVSVTQDIYMEVIFNDFSWDRKGEANSMTPAASTDNERQEKILSS